MKFNGWTALSLLILLVGIGFWAYMASAFGSGGDTGVYAVGITLIGFGLVGAFISLRSPPPA